ncbi:hypothetical protein F3Y22_tig00110429pilonHSYRG00369 [Hibiscus syriacus]|uniref:Uncharacterized protein n=1 Tax=Hibiscus syriacus TaxID=106335 RepID=A0A6A3AQZ7_HIBSY|nr:hypothetical protein F3Y22_tig00110429pilonHSYRG00369 [Hibiscus syriacus]
MWMPKMEYELIDVGEGYFLIKFSSLDDLKFALEGPWIIYGHYQSVRKWFADFHRSSTAIDSTAVWVDPNTSYASKGRFARVCVEIDFGKAVVPKIEVDGRWYSVEYEGLPMICFHCGKFGHRDCSSFSIQAPTRYGHEAGAKGSNRQSVGKRLFKYGN